MTVSGLESLLLFVYTAPFLQASGDPSLNIPLGKIFAALFVILIPVWLGLLLRHHSLYWARRAEISGTLVGLLLVFFIVAIILISFPSEIQREALVVPIFYGLAITPLALLGAWLLRNLEPDRGATEHAV